MTASSNELNPGTGGGKILVDSLPTNVNGATSPAGAVAQVVEIGYVDAGGTNLATVKDTQPLPARQMGLSTGGFFPAPKGAVFPSVANGTYASSMVDVAGNMMTRGPVITDETSMREDFPGSSLGPTSGTVVMTNGSTAVTGTGFFTSARHYDYIKLNADADAAWAQIQTINSDTSLTLVSNYSGTGGSGTGTFSTVQSVANGTAHTFANSITTINSGTATTSTPCGYWRNVDFGPLSGNWSQQTVSQRIANQDYIIGFASSFASTASQFARFRFTGTTNTVVLCESAYVRSGAPGASDTESTRVTFQNSSTSAVAKDYRVEVWPNVVRFYIDRQLVAEHTRHMPDCYDNLGIMMAFTNAATVAAGTATLDGFSCQNVDRLVIGTESLADSIVSETAPQRAANYNVAGVIAINTDLIVIDCLRHKSISIHCTSMGTTGVVTPQWSNDPAFATTATATMLTPAGATATTFNAAGVWNTPVLARYLRLRLTTATTAGTTTIFASGTAIEFGLWQATAPVTVSSGTVTTVTTLTTLANGQTAHSSASTGSPVRIGGRVITTLDTSLAQGDASDVAITTAQQLVTKPYGSAENDWQYATPIASPITNTTAVAIKAAGAASVRNYVTGIQYQNTSAVASIVTVQDNTTVIWTGYAPASMTVPAVVTFNTPLKGTAATAMNFVVNTTATNTFVSAQGYQSF